jgi:aldose 1-epimerase
MRKLEQQDWGQTTDNSHVYLFRLENGNGVVAKLTNYGATLVELQIPDREKRLGNVVLGFENLAGYLAGHPYFGATCGRVANRIARGRFTLDRSEFTLAVNNGRNHLHGGIKGFDKVVWNATPLPDGKDGPAVQFKYFSRNGEEGYPGNLSVKVTYTLMENNAIKIDYLVTTDLPTPINLTNHSYFNLAGQGDILSHELTIFADRYTPSDDEAIPTGELATVQGTPMDFRQPMAVGSRMAQLNTKPRGYDHNFVLNSGGGELALAARVLDATTGRVMEVFTTEPGVQLYTGNYLDGKLTGIGGVKYNQYSALCLETQHFPDAIHHPNFPSTILRPGQTYRTTTSYKFSITK